MGNGHTRVQKRENSDAFEYNNDSKRAKFVDSAAAALNQMYRQTDVTGGGLRLLKLHGGRSIVLRGSLVRHDTIEQSQNEPYDALSYTWGQAPATSKIEIIAQDYAHELPITPNLEAALRQFRNESISVQNSLNYRLLWIDAICINQDDGNEKNRQVPQMGAIFRQARKVLVWLGGREQGSDRAMRLLPQILDLTNIESLVRDQTTIDDWVSLFQLLRRSWFDRRWVLQEIALAKDATLYCGEDSVPWDMFTSAVSICASLYHQLQQLFLSSPKFDHNPDYLSSITESGALRLIQVVNMLFRKSDEAVAPKASLSLETLVCTLPAFEASRPEDTIYAVLSLAADARYLPENFLAAQSVAASEEETRYTARQLKALTTTVNLLRTRVEQKTYQVDYKKSFFEVCKDFLYWTMTRSESLDIICRPWAPTQTEETLPSWIPTLAQLAFRPDSRGVRTRVKADPLVGMPGIGKKRNYNASQHYPARWSFGSPPAESSLLVDGFVLDTIDVKCLPAQLGNVPYEWLLTGGWTTPADLPPDRFWRTLVGDRGPDGESPPVYYQRACRHAYAMGVEGDDLRTEPRHGCPDIIAGFLRRVQSVVWQRCMATTQENELLGLVPYNARENDLVCILYGCSVPVILRRYQEDSFAADDVGNTYYRFIGECYIHSVMDGGAFRFRDEKLERLKKEDPTIENLNVTFDLR
jgi:hypothetical protein